MNQLIISLKKSWVALPCLNKVFFIMFISFTFGFSCVLHQGLWPRVDRGWTLTWPLLTKPEPLVQAVSRGRGALSSNKRALCARPAVFLEDGKAAILWLPHRSVVILVFFHYNFPLHISDQWGQQAKGGLKCPTCLPGRQISLEDYDPASSPQGANPGTREVKD